MAIKRCIEFWVKGMRMGENRLLKEVMMEVLEIGRDVLRCYLVWQRRGPMKDKVVEWQNMEDSERAPEVLSYARVEMVELVEVWKGFG